MSRSGESGDYGMDDHASPDNQYDYHQESYVSTSDRDEDYEEGHSSGDYYGEEESHDEEEENRDVPIAVDDDMNEGEEIMQRTHGHHVGRVEGTAIYGQGNERLFSVQSLLGNIAQNLQDNGSSNRETIDANIFGSRQGLGNLAEAFPEIISLLSDGVRRSGNRERNDRLSTLVNNVTNASDDPYIAMESLRELSQHLLMVDQLVVERTLPIGKLLKAIIDVLSNSLLNEELELQLISCRCLFNLFEMNPESLSMAVDQGIIPTLQGKLQEISYIDLAEQVLETLELISRLHGKEVLRSGGLASCLQYLDFFTIHAQRKAVTIVSNSCCRVRAEDFETIRQLFTILKPIFINATDPSILDKLLNTLYGVCEGLRKKALLESFFDADILQRLGHLISISETNLESKLKCFDIISVLVGVSGYLSKEFIETSDVTNILMNCFNSYSKSPNAALHETLIYVPKPLLHAIARTIVLVFPTEYEQVLSMDSPKKNDFNFNDNISNKLLIDLNSLLIEIYVNTVDFEVRRLVLVALARVASCIKVLEGGSIDEGIIKLIGSTLAQAESLLDKEKDQKIISSTLIVGVLSLLDILTAKFSSSVLPTLKREGIFNLIQNLQTTIQKGQKGGKITVTAYDYETHQTALGHQEDSDNGEGEANDNGSVEGEEDEEEEDEYDTQFSSMEIPNEVKPNKIKFEVLKPPCLEFAYWKVYDLSKHLLTLFEEEEDAAIEELRDIEELVNYLHKVKIEVNNEECWREIWVRVKTCIFNGNFQISSFEFISTGLAAALSKIINPFGGFNMIPKRAFQEVFGDKIKNLIDILQSSLTRLEAFRIMECGLQDSEARIASLGKQVKIKLVYENGSGDDSIGHNFSSPIISIHCIATFKTLNEFLKHRIAQAKFLNSMLPNLTSPVSFSSEHDDVEEVRDWIFEFSTNEETLKLSDTIFYAIFRAFKSAGKDLSALWHEPHVIKFRRADKNKWAHPSSLTPLYNHQIELKQKILKPADDIFALLKFLNAEGLPKDIFINSKLSAKLSRQLEEPLVVASGILPDWTLQLTKKYPFLFPFDTRLFFLQCTSFGYGRLIQLWRNKAGDVKDSKGDDSLQKLGRITRHKLRISRATLFVSGLKVLDKYGSSPNVLEIEYQDEVGTGLGPTLEFYACVSREFTKKNLNMWRYDQLTNQHIDYVTKPLFPVPLNSNEDNTKVLELFRYLGTFVARSMLDNRILDFNFSKAFFELAHDRCRNRSKLNDCADTQEKLHVISLLDSHLAKSLKYLLDHGENEKELEQLTLFFTLPGYEFDLVENGSSVMVTTNNVQEYIQLVVDYTIGDGIEKQLEHFIEGFSKVFPYTSLLLFNPEELIGLYGSFEEDWSSATLYSSINADHGYTMDSSTIHELVSIMTSFTNQERRVFLQFLTGSPKLPIGGFKTLKPKLTVVLKHTDDGSSADAYLPSVMTCANYFKLPKYSDGTVMRSRIVQAMNEGIGAFLLS